MDDSVLFGAEPSFLDRSRIITALRGIDILHDREGRRMCAELSSEEIGEQVPGARKRRGTPADDAEAMRELVDWLLPRDVAIWIFIETLADLYGPCPEIDAVRAAVRPLVAQPVLTRAQRRDLHDICADLAYEHAADLFQRSVGPLGPPLRADPGNLPAVLNELEELPVRADDGLLPLVVFVEYLAAEQTPEAAVRLRAWSDAYYEDARAPIVSALHTVRTTAPPPRKAAPRYCSVMLDLDGVDDSRYVVSILLQEDDAEIRPLHAPDDRVYTEEEVRGLVGEALNHPYLTDVGQNDLVIEFVLPRRLMNHPVDQWTVGMARLPLGVQYPIVIRSLDRIRYAKSFHHLWQEKWSRVAEIEVGHTGEGYEWLVEEGQAAAPRLYVRLSGKSLPACLLLENTPDLADCPSVLIALQSGVPVLMWCRRPEVDMRRELTTLFPIRLAELPWRVFAYRRDAEADGVGDDHLARHLTVLWDDPNRIPWGDALEMPA